MISIIQRVSEAAVHVDGECVGRIERGLLVLLGVHAADTDADAQWMARKIGALRIFTDDAGKMNRSVLDERGGVLLVSNFTLCADTNRGNRPGFDRAMRPEAALPLVERVGELLAAQGVPVGRGRFGASMRVSLVNEGPVTIVLDSARAREAH